MYKNFIYFLGLFRGYLSGVFSFKYLQRPGHCCLKIFCQNIPEQDVAFLQWFLEHFCPKKTWHFSCISNRNTLALITKQMWKSWKPIAPRNATYVFLGPRRMAAMNIFIKNNVSVKMTDLRPPLICQEICQNMTYAFIEEAF